MQGEAKNLGTPALFIRFGGCNLRCTKSTAGFKCDSAYSYEGTEYNLNETFEIIDSLLKKYPKINRIIFTGGEPLLQEDAIFNIIRKLSFEYEDEFKFEIETNGTIEPFKKFDSNLCWGKLTFNISPKKQRIDLKILKEFIDTYDYIFKFVIPSKNQYNKWKKIIEQLNIPNDKVYMMPEGITKKILSKRMKSLIEWCKKDGFQVTPRFHIEIYGNIKRR